ncbi:MAG TPA: hypothetical protein VEI97_13175, partial [bacterium]|nr:hypothetical protein [bacterium]
TTEASLAADPDGTHVTADAVGEPSLSVCIPGVLGDDTAFFETGDVPTADDSAYGGDAAADSGQPGDEIFFAATVPQPATAGQSAGTYTGLVRAADPETGNEPYLVHLRGDLSPVTTSKPAPVTYQVLTVTVAVPPAPPGWAVRLGGTGFDFVRGVCTDSAGSVYAIGHFSGSADFGGGPRTSVGGTDIFLVKLNSDGSYAWDAVYGGSSDDIGTAIARDSADSLWITGGFRTTVNFGGGPLTAAGGSDVFLVKLDPITGGHLSSARYGGAGNDQANGVAVGVLNYPAITGQFIANVDFGGGNLASAGMADIFAAAFLSNGAHRWSKRFGGPADDFGSAICSYPADGSFALCGEFWNTINFGGPNRTSAGLTDIFLLRLDGVLGTYMFDRTFGGTNEEHAWGVAANVSSTVAMTGFFFSPVDFGGGPLNPGRMFLAAYDGTGTPLWSRSHGANSQEYSRAVAVDPNGDFCTVTAFIGTVNFGSGPLVAVGSTDIAISKYSGVSGAPLWSQRVGGSGTDESFAVTSLPNGDFVYAGAFRNTVDFDPGPGTFDLSAAGANDDAFVSRLSGTTGLW